MKEGIKQKNKQQSLKKKHDMINIKRFSGILTLAAITLFSSCSEWDDHFETDNNVSHATSNLYEALCQNSETSRFAELAASIGYDKVLSSSQTYLKDK